MLHSSEGADVAALEQCVDDIDQFVDALGYPQTVLAFALRIHLGALLRALVEEQRCTRQDVRQFVLELERESLGVGED